MSISRIEKLRRRVEEAKTGIPRTMARERGESRKLKPFTPQNDHISVYLEDIFPISALGRDTSETGTGKSIVEMALSKKFDIPMMIVCPAGVVDAWVEKLNQYDDLPGKPVIRYSEKTKTKKDDPDRTIVISYDMLARNADGEHEPKFARFVGVDYTKTGKKKKDNAEAGVDFLERMERGVLLVLDESHFTKNDTAQRTVVATSLANKLSKVILRSISYLRGIEEEEYNRVYKETRDKELAHKKAKQKAEKYKGLGFKYPEGEGASEDFVRGRPRNYNMYSRTMMLSATPIDKEKQVNGIIKAMGISADTRWVYQEKVGEGRSNDKNLMSLIKSAASTNIDATRSVLMRYEFYLDDIDSDNYEDWDYSQPRNIDYSGPKFERLVSDMVFNLTSTVLLKEITNEMIPYIERNAFRGYFDIDPFGDNPRHGNMHPESEDENLRRYMKAVTKLMGFVAKDDGKGRSVIEKDRQQRLKAIVEAIGDLDECCYEGAVYALYQDLISNKDSKVILIVNRLTTVDAAGELFEWLIKCYNQEHGTKISPRVGKATGKVGKKEKDENISEFQEDNGNMRVLVMIASTALGIDLDDRSVNGRPRFLCIIPNFDAMAVHQGCGRIFRVPMRTIGRAYIFYPAIASAACELVIEILRQKSGVLFGSISRKRETEQTIRRFPGTYMRMIRDSDENNMPIDYYVDETRIESKDAEFSNLRSDAEFMMTINGIGNNEGQTIVPIRDQPYIYRPGGLEINPIVGLTYKDKDKELWPGWPDATRIPPTYEIVGGPDAVKSFYRRKGLSYVTRDSRDATIKVHEDALKMKQIAESKNKRR